MSLLSTAHPSIGPGLLRTAQSLGHAELGVEVGSLSTFFSMQHPRLGALEVLRLVDEHQPERRRLLREVRMADAHLLIEETEQADYRTLTVTALDDSLLMDAVLRFEIPLEQVAQASLGNEVIAWARANHYHQRPACRATVRLKDGTYWSATPCNAVLPVGMSLLTYLRDEPDRWILHVRARAERPDVYSLRGCTRWYNKPLPAWCQRVLSKAPRLASRLLYLRERVSQRIPFQANGAVRLKAGEALSFSVRVRRNTTAPEVRGA